MVDNLEVDTASVYLEGLRRLEAQEALLAIKVASYPYMKKDEKTKTHKDLYKLAYPKEKRKLSLDDLEAMLRG